MTDDDGQGGKRRGDLLELSKCDPLIRGGVIVLQTT